MKTWNICEVESLEENIKEIEKETDMVQGVLMNNPPYRKKMYIYLKSLIES